MCYRNLKGIATSYVPRRQIPLVARSSEFFWPLVIPGAQYVPLFIRPTPVLRLVFYPRHNFRVFDTFRVLFLAAAMDAKSILASASWQLEPAEHRTDAGGPNEDAVRAYLGGMDLHIHSQSSIRRTHSPGPDAGKK